jgi:hypothetical protein
MDNQIIRSVNNPNMCLDVPSGAKQSIYPLQSSSCVYGEGQQWTYKDGSIINKGSGMCLDVKGASTTPGTEVGQWQCHGGDNQKWTYNTNKTFSLAKTPNKCLDLSGGVAGQGTKLIIWDCHGGSNQQWKLEGLPRTEAALPKEDALPKVTLHEDCDYKGKYFALGVGRYDTNNMGIDNTTLSSIHIPAGISVTLFEKSGFSGAELTITSDVACLTSVGWNDRASSIIIKPTVNENMFIFDPNVMQPGTIYYQNGIWQTSKPGSLAMIFKVVADGDFYIQLSPTIYNGDTAAVTRRNTYTLIVGGETASNKTFIFKNGIDTRDTPDQFVKTPITRNQETTCWLSLINNNAITLGLGDKIGQNIVKTWIIDTPNMTNPPVKYVGLGGYTNMCKFTQIRLTDGLTDGLTDIKPIKYTCECDWKCLPGINTPVSVNPDGDIQCMSENGKDCMWQNSEAECLQLIERQKVKKIKLTQTGGDGLSCGEQMKSVWGITGYDTPDNWCSKAKSLIDTPSVAQPMPTVAQPTPTVAQPTPTPTVAQPTSTVARPTPTVTRPTPTVSKSEEIEETRDYTFHSGMDSQDNNIIQVASLKNNVHELKVLCDKTPNCAGFNTEGWLKNKVKSEKQWNKISDDPKTGLYVLKPDVCQTKPKPVPNKEPTKITNVSSVEDNCPSCGIGNIQPKISVSFPSGLNVPSFPSGLNVPSFPSGLNVPSFPSGLNVPSFPSGLNVPSFPSGLNVPSTAELGNGHYMVYLFRLIFLFCLVYFFASIIPKDPLDSKVRGILALLVVVIYSMVSAIRQFISDSKTMMCTAVCPKKLK